ncbi:MalM family protein [Vibrio aestuarianus]|uniref:MalM family protein n=1 Tax=Vibrio aestuarianus TaxID=28171 RepID=UPI00237D2D0A|nr:MalM family protein [Vibrio aestuarianus]MDE1264511.1 MalM family protein [Vibrio aestuarianus]MDE1296439.1 MalM family protein [Vibrio aestuarianus]
MKHLVLGCAISIALLGCTTTETIVFDASNASQVVESYAQIHWVDVEPTKRVNFSIDENNQRFELPTGISSIAAFNIDTQGKELDLEIISHFKKTVLYPNALLLNENNQVLKSFGTEDFEYKHAYGFEGDRLTTEVTIQPVGKQRVKLLIYTTPELLSGESEVLHPVKLDAIARGNYPPDVPNPKIPHSQFGELSIVAKVDSAIVVQDAVTVSSTDTAQQKFKDDLAAQEKPSVQTTTVIASELATNDISSILSAEQQQFYLSSIENAVNVGMIDKALSLLDEAKALGIEGAQEVFVKAINTK